MPRPAAARSSAIARPMPLEPPVINAASTRSDGTVRGRACARFPVTVERRTAALEHAGDAGGAFDPDPNRDPRPELARLDRAQGSRRRNAKTLFVPVFVETRRGRARHRRRRQHVHRLRRRHRLPRRRALERRRHERRARAGRPLPAHRLHDHAVRLVRRARRAAAARGCRSAGRPRPRSSTAAPRRSRTPSRSRGGDRAPGGDRVRRRVPRAHA